MFTTLSGGLQQLPDAIAARLNPQHNPLSLLLVREFELSFGVGDRYGLEAIRRKVNATG